MSSLGSCTGAKKNVGDYNWWVITRLTGCRNRGYLELPLLFSALFLISTQELPHCTRESRQERPPMCMETHVLPVGHEMSTVIRINLCHRCTGWFFLTPPPAAHSHHLSCTYGSFQAAFQTTSINPDQDNQLSASWFRGASAYTRTGMGRNGPLQHHWEFVQDPKSDVCALRHQHQSSEEANPQDAKLFSSTHLTYRRFMRPSLQQPIELPSRREQTDVNQINHTHTSNVFFCFI